MLFVACKAGRMTGFFQFSIQDKFLPLSIKNNPIFIFLSVFILRKQDSLAFLFLNQSFMSICTYEQHTKIFILISCIYYFYYVHLFICFKLLMSQSPRIIPSSLFRSRASESSSSSNKMSSKVPVQFTSQIRLSKKKSHGVELSLIKLASIGSITCQLCQQIVPPTEACSIGECEHNFCKDCLTQYSIYKINVTEEVKCPEENCNSKLTTESPIYELFPQNIKERYKHQELWRQTINNPNIKICPFEDCKDGIVDLLLDPPTCKKCKKQYCKECMMQVHEGRPCDDNFQGHFKEWKRCPNCKMFIQKDGGCNHITCQCGHEFCFVCLSNWENDHYQCLEGMQNRLFLENTDELSCLPSFGCLIIMLVSFPILLALFFVGAALSFAIFCVIGILVTPCITAKQMPECCCICWLIGLPLIMAVGGIVIPLAFLITNYFPQARRIFSQYCNSVSFLAGNICH